MLKANNREKFQELRTRYPVFTYEGFEYMIQPSSLDIVYRFSISGQFRFNPTLSVPIKPGINFHEISTGVLENILFNIGMAELVSYWKCTCSPRIIVKNSNLTEEQKSWWKKLYYHGLGEFMYLNSIDINRNDFVEIESTNWKEIHPFHIFSYRVNTYYIQITGK